MCCCRSPQRPRQIGDDRLRERSRLAVRDVERLLAGVEPRQAQQILDQALHALGVTHDDREEAPAVVGIGVALGQRFDVPADRRQRRPQLVRHVRHEVAPNLIRAPQVGDVVHHDDDAVRRVAGGRRRAGDDRPRGIARRRKLQRFRRAAEQGGGDQFRYRGMTNRLHVRTPDPDAVQLQHSLRGVVGELEPSLWVHDDDPFDHAGEDRFHPAPIARLFGEATGDVLHRFVQRSGHHAELVVAKVHPRGRQVAAAVAAGEVGDAAHALPDARREDPGDEPRAENGEGQRSGCDGERRLEVDLRPRHDGEQTDSGRHGDERRSQRSEEELGGHCSAAGASTSLYPNCFTVTSASISTGSFSRSRRTCTSTVRVPPV